jgi:3-hydroxyisobutyrate dehydrogenase-like beta-hydroxyacid dehydrogenase
VTARVAFLGVGRMGSAMAGRLLAAGHPVVAYDPNVERRAAMVARGAQAADSVAACCRGAEIVFSSVFDDRALREVALGPEGVLATVGHGSVYADFSTVSPGASAEVAAGAAARGVAYLRIPVSGNPVAAQAGQLTALVSGPADAWSRVHPLVAAFAARQVYLGADEQARYMKLVVNLLILNTAALLGESLALGRKGGLEWNAMLDALVQSAIGSPWLKIKADFLKTRDFTPTITVREQMKDLDLMLAAAAAAEVPLPLTALTRQLMQAAIGDGLGDEDFIAVVKQVERQSGLPTDRV